MSGPAVWPSDSACRQLLKLLRKGNKQQKLDAVETLMPWEYGDVADAEIAAWIDKISPKMMATEGCIASLIQILETNIGRSNHMKLLYALCTQGNNCVAMKQHIAEQRPDIVAVLLRILQSPSSLGRTGAVSLLMALSECQSINRSVASSGGIPKLVHTLRTDSEGSIRSLACSALDLLIQGSYHRAKDAADVYAVKGIAEFATSPHGQVVADGVSGHRRAVLALGSIFSLLKLQQLPEPQQRMVLDALHHMMVHGTDDEKVPKKALLLVCSLAHTHESSTFAAWVLEKGVGLTALAIAKRSSTPLQEVIFKLLHLSIGCSSKQQRVALAEAGLLDMCIELLLDESEASLRLHRCAAVHLSRLSEADKSYAWTAAAAGVIPSFAKAAAQLSSDGVTPQMLLAGLALLLAHPCSSEQAQQALDAGVLERLQHCLRQPEAQLAAVALLNSMTAAAAVRGDLSTLTALRGLSPQLVSMLQDDGLPPKVAQAMFLGLGNMMKGVPGPWPDSVGTEVMYKLAMCWLCRQDMAAAVQEMGGANPALDLLQTYAALHLVDLDPSLADSISCRVMEASVDFSGAGGAAPGPAAVVAAAQDAAAVRRAAERAVGAKCAWCGASSRPDGGRLSWCSRCSQEQYCSAACLKRHWREHKEQCAAATQARGAHGGWRG